jgi:multiple sugar transport system permease protein
MATETITPTPSRFKALANRNWLAIWFMLPAAVLLLCFSPIRSARRLAGLHRHARRPPGIFIGLENYEWLWDDSIFWLSVFNTLLYTIVASMLKFASAFGSRCCSTSNLPFKAFIRGRADPVHRADRALRHRLLVDLRFAVLDHFLVADRDGLIDSRTSISSAIRQWARASVIAANVWRGVPFVAITLLAGLQTVSPSLYEAATLDGASALAALPLRHAAAADAHHRGHHDLLGAVHLHRFPADLRLTRGGPVNATHLMATLSYQRGISAAGSARALRSRPR